MIITIIQNCIYCFSPNKCKRKQLMPDNIVFRKSLDKRRERTQRNLDIIEVREIEVYYNFFFLMNNRSFFKRKVRRNISFYSKSK